MPAVAYMWCGRPAVSSLQPRFVLDGAGTVRAAVSATADFAAPVYSAAVATDAQFVAKTAPVTGLAAGTRWYYAPEINGTLDLSNVGRARTLPASGPLRVTFGSCWSGPGQTGVTSTPDHPVGAAVAAKDADLHIFHGDMGYPDIGVNDQTLFRANYALMHGLANFRTMMRNLTFDYIPSDHDATPNNGDSTSPGLPAFQTVYRQVIPSHDLPDTTGVYHSFTSGDGRVRFVSTDLRSYRTPNSATDNTAKTMLGTVQKQWLKDQWLAAKQAGQLIVWVSEQIWCIDGTYVTSGINTDNDHWGAFTTERAELDNYRASNGIKNMVILCGDGHQISYRRNVDYSTAGGVGVPVYSAAAYSRTQAYRPGAWEQTSAAADADGHYALMTVTPLAGAGFDVGVEFHDVSTAGVDVVAFSAPSVQLGVPAPGTYAVRTSDGKLAVPLKAGVRNYIQIRVTPPPVAASTVGFDTDGTPYFDPAGVPTSGVIRTDTDGTPYVDTTGTSTTTVAADTDGTPYVQ
jgi:hypothetical protein